MNSPPPPGVEPQDPVGDDGNEVRLSPEMELELARLKPEEAGERIGNYKLLQQLGEGGFGTVWMAEQGKPVRREVALKVIKLGMDTKEVIARFEQERQALAMMDHPNIAKVLDAGVTPTGRPYFVMELVKGVKITDYCDQAHLTTAERLELFVQVCSAVQHAHQKGIIHRDLKPSNVLVTLQDGAAVPKVIDFGVAKAMQQRLTELTFVTQVEQMLGTPLYMSPEQAEMSGLDVDTRTDIYSLGVLLYELLIGRTPFDAEEFMRQGYDGMRRMIREQEPMRPSRALSSMGREKLLETASRRRCEPPRLVAVMKGDLDWIVMKAIEKDRARRYETANGFAMDVQRYLHNEPVVARPPTASYRLRKMAQRNKAAFVAAFAVALVLMAATPFATWQAVKARRAEKEQRHLRAAAEETNVRLLRTSADLWGRKGEWESAARDLGDLLKLDKSDHWDWFRYATLLVEQERIGDYKKLRRRMLARFRDTTEAQIADRVAKAALLLPGKAEELAEAEILAHKALVMGANERFLPYYQLTAALAAYRGNRMNEAKELVEKAVAAERLDINIQALPYVQLAMIQQQLGDTEKARLTMAEAENIANKAQTRETGSLEYNYWAGWWHDWLILGILREEMKEMVE